MLRTSGGERLTPKGAYEKVMKDLKQPNCIPPFFQTCYPNWYFRYGEGGYGIYLPRDHAFVSFEGGDSLRKLTISMRYDPKYPNVKITRPGVAYEGNIQLDEQHKYVQEIAASDIEDVVAFADSVLEKWNQFNTEVMPSIRRRDAESAARWREITRSWKSTV